MEPTREERMLSAYVGGATLKEIGDEWGVSGERVRQIVRPLLTAEQQEQRSANVAARSTTRHPEIIEYLDEHPNEPLTDIADKFGVSRRTVARLWDGPPRQRKARSSTTYWSEGEMIESIRTVLTGRTPSCAAYMRAVHDGPSLALIIRHFGTWHAAVEAAGLSPISPPNRTYERATDDWDSLFADSVQEFMAVEMEGGHTWRHFVQWAKGRTPSPHTMRAMANITYGEAQRRAQTD